MMSDRKKIITTCIASAVLLIAFTTGCGNQQKDPGDVTDLKAALTVNFDPNPATRVADGAWAYSVIVTETAGIGVNIYGAQFERFALSDESSGSGNIEQIDFESQFFACGGEGNYIPPGAVRCSNRGIKDVNNLGYVVYTFFGVDDFGNEIIAEGRVDLL